MLNNSTKWCLAALQGTRRCRSWHRVAHRGRRRPCIRSPPTKYDEETCEHKYSTSSLIIYNLQSRRCCGDLAKHTDQPLWRAGLPEGMNVIPASTAGEVEKPQTPFPTLEQRRPSRTEQTEAIISDILASSSLGGLASTPPVPRSNQGEAAHKRLSVVLRLAGKTRIWTSRDPFTYEEQGKGQSRGCIN